MHSLLTHHKDELDGHNKENKQSKDMKTLLKWKCKNKYSSVVSGGKPKQEQVYLYARHHKFCA